MVYRRLFPELKGEEVTILEEPPPFIKTVLGQQFDPSCMYLYEVNGVCIWVCEGNRELDTSALIEAGFLEAGAGEKPEGLRTIAQSGKGYSVYLFADIKDEAAFKALCRKLEG